MKKIKQVTQCEYFFTLSRVGFVKYLEMKSYVEMKTISSIFQSSFALLKCDWWSKTCKCDKSAKNERNL